MRNRKTLFLILPVGLALGAASASLVKPEMKDRVAEPYQLGRDGQPESPVQTYRAYMENAAASARDAALRIRQAAFDPETEPSPPPPRTPSPEPRAPGSPLPAIW
ncbi:hypothetical protein FHS61_001372 [Altererythrobacter atlanticus]|uniref:Uncharacterized protein n=1 Tax=Croceibacterium atlanticum TaxID=1267766 RepID=A0A0F7KXT6_9SPHN|nr:hypothetical protein [Croceibacterium atlanticum]AKH44056.1 hypothetical protein WYH_03036 [Croceibacterium atlanticum]MBB5732363.1 hypothetical protein [Croceibacterium atlanticum]